MDLRIFHTHEYLQIQTGSLSKVVCLLRWKEHEDHCYPQLISLLGSLAIRA